MKDLKKKLTASVAMLGVSAVMLSGVSYAWYTLSTNPEVKGIKATAVANENLEIALLKAADENVTAVDTRSQQSANSAQGSTTDNYYTWGNVVDMTSILHDVELRPATYESTPNTSIAGNTSYTVTGGTEGLYYPSYGKDGRISGFNAVTDGTYETDKESFVNVFGGTDATAQKYAFRVDYWLRTNVAGNITLSTAEKHDTTNEADADKGAGSYIETTQFGTNADQYPTEAIKVLFKVVNTTTNATTWVQATNGTLAGNKVPLEATLISNASANTAYKVSMYVYLNGNVVTNAMAEAAVDDISVNVQFDNAGITNGAMQK